MNFDDNTQITVSEDLLDVLSDLADIPMNEPVSSISVLSRWSKRYLRSQMPLPASEDYQFQYNVTSNHIRNGLNIGGQHPLSAAKKTNLIVTGSKINMNALFRTEERPPASPYNPSFTPPKSQQLSRSGMHLLIMGLEIDNIIYINRTLDEDFMREISRINNMQSSQRGVNVQKSPELHEGNLGSQVVKVSNVKVCCNYQLVAPHYLKETNLKPLRLSPLILNIGLINLNSKSSLSLEMKSRANNDTAVVKNEKFNIQMENVTLKFSCDMLIQCMQLLELRQETSDVVMRMGVVQAIEEIVMKLRMTSACERYQQSFLHYGLLQNVIVEWGNDG